MANKPIKLFLTEEQKKLVAGIAECLVDNTSRLRAEHTLGPEPIHLSMYECSPPRLLPKGDLGLWVGDFGAVLLRLSDRLWGTHEPTWDCPDTAQHFADRWTLLMMELLGMLATLGAARAKTYKEAPREEDTASDTDHHMDATI